MQTSQNGSFSAKASSMVIGTIALMIWPPICSGQMRLMPAIKATTLSGEAISLPGATRGKPIVLVFGFARSAKDEGEVWGKELVEMQQERNDFNFFQVATLSEAPRFMQGFITRAIRASVPVAYYPHMLLLTESDKAWRGLLGARNDGSAYVVLCSPEGEVEWQTRGSGHAQFEALRAQLRKDDAKHRAPQGGSDVDF